jgi:hypothetical protein
MMLLCAFVNAPNYYSNLEMIRKAMNSSGRTRAQLRSFDQPKGLRQKADSDFLLY